VAGSELEATADTLGSRAAGLSLLDRRESKGDSLGSRPKVA
jgi:hypothetical protein